MKLFASFLPHLLKSKGLYTEAKAAYVLEKMRQIIENHLGKESRNEIIPKKIFEKKIYLAISSSSWRNEIFMKKKIFLELLALDCPEEEIIDIILL